MFAESTYKIMASSQYVIVLVHPVIASLADVTVDGRKKDELCHMVNRSNTLLVNTVLS
jgi:hypothetical protein